MITAVFTDNDDYAHAYGLWQWDYGQQLRIEGLHLPTAVEIHFALQETGGEAITRVGTTKDGVTTVTIPDSVLEGNRATWTADKAYNIYAWVYLSDKSSGETIKRITMQVKSRPKPEAFEAPGDGEIFHEAIEAVNDAAKRAEEAGGKAVVAADEAKAAATQTAKHLEAVQGLAEQVETNADTVAQDKQAVAGMLSQVQQAASDAALSAQAAKLSETAAAQAQTGAEAAEDGARQYAEETRADRQAVTEDKQAVSQMRENVAADRQAVEQTALQFGQTSQDALTAIGQAQSTAVGAVKAEGNKQTTAVQEAGTQAVSEVTEAKTTAVEAVTAEGDKQTKRVEDAAAGIVADREQINQNKTDIAGLVEGMTDLAPAILNTASGSVITADDAAEGRPFRGLRVFGRTEQVRTTGAQLLDLSDKIGKTQTKNGVTYIINDDQSITVSGKTGDYTSFYIKDMALKAGTYFLKNESRDKNKKIFIQLIGDRIKEGVFTLDKDVSSIGVYFVFNVFGGTVNIFNDTVTTMLNEGSTALPWEPYTGGKPSPSPEYPQEIVSAGESGSIKVGVMGSNFLDITDAKDNRISVSIQDDVITVKKLITTDGIYENVSYDFRLSAGTYVFQCDQFFDFAFSEQGNRCDLYRVTDAGLKYIGSLHERGTLKIIFSLDKGENLRLIVRAGYKEAGKSYKIKGLRINTLENQQWEPYRDPQTLTLQTPNVLPGVPVSKDGNYTDPNGQQWICDEIDLERGKYVQRTAEKEVSGITWSGAGTWGNTDDYKTLAFYAYIDGSNINEDWDAVKNYGICNYATITSNVFNNSIIGFTLGDYIAFRVPRNLLPDWDENNPSNDPWVNWLKARKEAGNPVIVRYALKTSIERDLTPEEIAAYKALRTYGPTTVISNDTGAGMEVTYVADTKAYIDKKFKELNQAIVNTQIALL